MERRLTAPPPLTSWSGDDESGTAEEVFAQARNAGPVWVESESLRISVAGYDGHVFGSGWSRDEPAHQI